jgi:mannose/fructose/N-acetylgalactosamine-specific phosphotransferase system component IIC
MTGGYRNRMELYANNMEEEIKETAPVERGAEAIQTVATEEAHQQQAAPSEGRAMALAVAGWILPGLGHALQRMWGRALMVFLTVGILVLVGASMRGNIFTSNGNDAFDTLGYVADMGAGSFYFVARSVERNGSDVSDAQGDYGTRFLATAGVLNLLAALHAYEAARGRKA